MQEKKAVAKQIRSRYLKAGRKEKSAILDEFILTTGYKNRKYALRILNQPQAPQALLVVKGKAVKLKPKKPKLPNRTGKKIYTDEVINSLRLIWTFFWYKCGKLLVSRHYCNSERCGIHCAGKENKMEGKYGRKEISGNTDER
jgi:hypothetical protein